MNWKPWLIEIDDKHDDFTMNGNSSHQTVKLPEDNPIYIYIYILYIYIWKQQEQQTQRDISIYFSSKGGRITMPKLDLRSMIHFISWRQPEPRGRSVELFQLTYRLSDGFNRRELYIN